MKKLISLLALLGLGANAATFPTDFGSVPNAQARANVTNIASVPLALQSGTSLDWAGITHEKRLFREITTDTTFTFANLPTSVTQSVTLVLYLTNNGPAGVASVTFPATVQWPGTFGAPTILQLSNAVTRYEFEHMGGGRVFGYDRTRFTVLQAGGGITLSSIASTTTVSALSTNWLTDANGNGYGVNFFALKERNGIAILQLYSNTSTNGGNSSIEIYGGGVLAPFKVTGDEYITAKLGIAIPPSGTTANLEVRGLVGGTANALAHIGTNDANGLTVSSNGNVGIGTTTPLYKLHVLGDAYVTNGMVIMAKNTVAPSAPLTPGGGLFHDGTNLCEVVMNGAGVLSTNKYTTKAAWP